MPGALITNAAMLNWSGYRMQLGPVTAVVTLPYGTLALGPYQGGQLYHKHGISLTVPPNAVSDTTRFEIEALFADTGNAIPPGSLLFANRAFEMNAWSFGEPVGQFNRPLTITVHYSDTDVQGLKRETLRLWKREGPGDPWTLLDEAVSVTSSTLTFSTTHLCQFALFAEAIDGDYPIYLPLIKR